MKNIALAIGAVAIIVLAVLAFNHSGNEVSLGGTLQARLLATATSSVGHQQDRTLFTAKEYCASRVISTLGVPVSLSFKSSSIDPTSVRGHLQGASTTVAYDSGLYGCGEIVAAASATTTVTIAEFVY